MGSVQPLFLEAIDRAIQRSRRFDLNELVDRAQNEPPEAIASAEALNARRSWLNGQDRSRTGGLDPTTFFERIISGNELQDVAYLERGMIAARSVCRIKVRTTQGQSGWGTGFLVAPNVLITNNHVLENPTWAERSRAQFRYERDLGGLPLNPIEFRLRPDQLFYTNAPLDFTVVAVEELSENSETQLSSFGYLPLDGRPGKVTEGEWLTIVQHPAGDFKQVCVRENQLLKRDDDVLWYSTDTLAGSSGSPVFSNDWLVVALHHSGVPEKKNGRIQTVTGEDFDERRHAENDIKWQANEGIRVSRIVQTLKAEAAANPLVQRVLSGTPPIFKDESASTNQDSSIPKMKQSEVKMPKRVTITLEIDDAGVVRVAPPNLEGDFQEAKKKKGTRDQSGNLIDAPADPTFPSSLKGYDPNFLGAGVTVNLPKLPSGATPAPLIADRKSTELKYENFSVIQNANRRLAYVSAANIDGGGRFRLSGRDDNWLIDPRISIEHQLGPSYYSRNKLDRGHLTRREDLEFGTSVVDAVRSANGTNVYTNCAPQHEEFNQGFGTGIGGDSDLWQGLEQYILEQTAVSESLRICVFTGPVFDQTDPVYRGFQIPLEFWKVIVGLTSTNAPFATGYLLSQEPLIDVTGLDESTIAQPFGAYKTYQVKISQISALTGLKFTGTFKTKVLDSLAGWDPLENRSSRRPTRGAKGRRSFESTLVSGSELVELEDIIL